MVRGRISCIYKGGGEASLQSTIDQQQDMRASLTTGETCHSCETLRQTRWQEAQLKSNLCLQEITQKKLFENQEVVNFIGTLYSSRKSTTFNSLIMSPVLTGLYV